MSKLKENVPLLIIIVLLLFAMFFVNGSIVKRTPCKKIALTFDDGPHPQNTDKVLKVLNDYNVHATFFLLGKNVKAHPEIVKRIVRHGHIIGNHSYDHDKLMCDWSNEVLYNKEVIKCERLIHDILGIKSRLYRPPYGHIRKRQEKFLRDRGYLIVLWDIWTEDTRPNRWKLEKQLERVKSNLSERCIVLMHDPSEKTYEALPAIIEYLIEEKYEFVTIDEYLNNKPYF